MLERLLRWVADRRPARFIRVNDAPYLERYFLFSLFGWRFYLHRFMSSDSNREGLHNHPFRWAVSLILTNGYSEERVEGYAPDGLRQRIRVLRRFALNFLTPNAFHRVILNRDENGKEKPTWTLFVLSENAQPWWGFLRTTGFMPDDKEAFLGFIPVPASAQDWYLNAPKGRTLSW